MPILPAMSEGNANRILPRGTRIVCLAEPEGAVGVIVDSPADATHAYRVELADGRTLSLRRAQLQILKTHQKERSQGDPLEEYDLREHVIYRCISGSRAYGLDGEASDTDTRGIYLPPAQAHWSLWGVPDQLENKAIDEVYWELGKFIRLALKANPNILECLYSPIVEHIDPIAQELIDMRDAFLSQLAYQTYSGYVISQFKKIEADLRNHGEVRWKHAMHLIRLQLAGLGLLQEGSLKVDVGNYRESLLAIKRGERSWDEVNQWRLDLQAELERAYQSTPLPEKPDYEAANAYLVRARRSAVGEE